MNRKQEIQEAAFNEFTQKGYAGARMQAIADNVGVTKAMIHYYFESKENLFRNTYEKACEILLTGLFESLEKDIPLFQKIEQFIDIALNRFINEPKLARFVIHELDKEPDITKEILHDVLQQDFSKLETQLQKAADNYEITPVSSDQLIANIISLSVFPTVGRTFLTEILQKDEDTYQQFLKQRRESVKDTIINWMAG